jgi:imidazole glycerol-phosphate synthase subunit HisH
MEWWSDGNAQRSIAPVLHHSILLMIGIIDYGMGNLGSVSNACAFLGLEARILTRPDEMPACRAVILPGVGAFGDCMAHLQQHGFVEAVKTWIGDGRPFLGICLGLQTLYEAGEESPGVKGLGILPGEVRRFRLPAEYKVPQIGWNSVRQTRPDCPLFKDVPDESFFYFVHSYYAGVSGGATDAGVTAYGIEYASAIWKDNVIAVQFHPEKSQKVGLQMLKNFAEWAKAC